MMPLVLSCSQNGGEPYEEQAILESGCQRRPIAGIHIRSAFETVFHGSVMVDARAIMDGSEGGQDNISLCWVQVAA